MSSGCARPVTPNATRTVIAAIWPRTIHVRPCGRLGGANTASAMITPPAGTARAPARPITALRPYSSRKKPGCAQAVDREQAGHHRERDADQAGADVVARDGGPRDQHADQGGCQRRAGDDQEVTVDGHIHRGEVRPEREVGDHRCERDGDGRDPPGEGHAPMIDRNSRELEPSVTSRQTAWAVAPLAGRCERLGQRLERDQVVPLHEPIDMHQRRAHAAGQRLEAVMPLERVDPDHLVRLAGEPAQLAVELLEIAALPAVGGDHDRRPAGDPAPPPLAVVHGQVLADPRPAAPVGQQQAGALEHRRRVGAGQVRRQPGQPRAEGERLQLAARAVRRGQRLQEHDQRARVGLHRARTRRRASPAGGAPAWAGAMSARAAGRRCASPGAASAGHRARRPPCAGVSRRDRRSGAARPAAPSAGVSRRSSDGVISAKSRRAQPLVRRGHRRRPARARRRRPRRRLLEHRAPGRSAAGAAGASTP